MTGAWHDDGSAVVTLTFDVDAETPILAAGARYADHLMTMSHQAYGPDVGVPRILELLDDLGVPATFFVPGWVAERRPAMVAAIAEHGHEIAHHTYSHRAPTSLHPDEERADFERGLAVFADQGIEIVGYRAAQWEAARSTFGLLRDHGLRYDSSLMGDDRPYALDLGDGVRIAELPVHWSLDDWEQYAFLPEPQIGSVIESPRKVLELWRAELDAMRNYRCLFNLCLHPFLSGRPSRLAAVRELIEYGLGLGDVRFRRCRDVAEAALADPDVPTRGLPDVTVDRAVYPD
ncbi:polysaccharide deacetylase [Kribbella amoyensis]|uniref:Polysaccharide deacetylase n=1 Tax=Kribbella amoyensis TaxID=996641 RepID=A0A561BV02_9ACTN|nr:polysaccharide deacetylase [Kribbella amoyensis]TWD82678.1 polysaccharide deacetylase [Kribbella amoyensis]